MEVESGLRVGPYKLGMTVRSCVAYLHAHAKEIAHVEMHYDSENPNHPIQLNILSSGVLLSFHAEYQRLLKIEVYDLSLLTLVLRGKAFSGPAQEPTYELIYDLFGLTTPGRYDPSSSIYKLRYPGICFDFMIPRNLASHFTGGQDSQGTVPINLPGGYVPFVESMVVWAGDDCEEPDLVPLSSSLRHYMEEVDVVAGKGIRLMGRGVEIQMGDTVQKVISELGEPDKITTARERAPKLSYYFNYFHLGIDILWGPNHQVIRIVLHTNHPNHFDFSLYHRCNLRLSQPQGPSDDEDVILIETEEVLPDVDNSMDTQFVPVSSRRKKRKKKKNRQPVVEEVEEEEEVPTADPFLTVKQVKSMYLGFDGEPLVATRGLSSSPFGATYYYGKEGVIIEAMTNGYISTVILYEASAPQTGPN